MADEEQLRILRQGVKAWNAWRQDDGKGVAIDLSGADLFGADLREADLSEADLRDVTLRLANLDEAKLASANLKGADLGRAYLGNANLEGANLSGATLHQARLGGGNLARTDLTGADLGRAQFIGVDLSEARLVRAHLRQADFSGANLHQTKLNSADFGGANLSGATLRGADLGGALLRSATFRGADLDGAHVDYDTIISNTDLSDCKNLDSMRHTGRSLIDFHTLQRSGSLPLAFLRGVGLPEKLIEYLPSILGEAIQHYSCFISYSSRDEEFAHRLHADLQDKGVRCWFAPHDMKIGAKILDTIDEAIRLRDKVLLVLSEASIAAEWVEIEVKKALAEERQRRTTVLFPVRLDEAVFETKEAWAALLREDRNIGDFRAWKDHDAYQKALERVLRDLRVESSEPA